MSDSDSTREAVVIPIGKPANTTKPSKAAALLAAIRAFDGLCSAEGAPAVAVGGALVRARTAAFHSLVRQRLGDPDIAAVTINAATDALPLGELTAFVLPRVVRAPGEGWRDRLQYARDGELRSTGENVATILLNHPDWQGVVAYDLFKEAFVARVVPPWPEDHRPASARPGPWRDEDDALLQAWLARFEGADFGTEAIAAGLSIAAGKHEFHPVREYLRGITWDGVKRLETFLPRYFKTADTAWERRIGPAWFRSCVARVELPGCQVDHALVIEGPQGWGKSTGLEALVHDRGWFADSGLDITNKDSYEALRGVWIYCIGELASLAKGDVDRWKNFISSKQDHYRESYGRRTRDHLRQTVFAADTNRDRYLSDATGGRRWWPAKVLGRVDVEGIRRDRDQLWAEAFATYSAGEPWWLPDDVGEHLAKDRQTERMVEEPWDTLVADWLANPTREEWSTYTFEDSWGASHPKKSVSIVPHDISRGLLVADVLAHALKLKPEQMRGEPANRVAAILTRKGWTSRRCEVDGERAVRWFPASKGAT